MRLSILIFGRTFFIASVLVLRINVTSAQLYGDEKWKQPGFFIGFSGDLTNAQIINKETHSISNLVSNKEISGFGSIEIGYFVSKYIGLTSGAYYNTFSSKLFIDSYENQYNTIDRENESFEMRVSGFNIGELQKVDILNIPVCLNFRVPINLNIGLCFQTGINLKFPIMNSFESSGIFTYKGYFPAYNVLLENLPEYGFPTELSVKTKGELELKPLIYGAMASAGMDYLINKRFQMTLAAYYDRSVSSITNYSFADDFDLMTDAGQFNSILSGSSKTALQSIALKLGLRYYFSDYTKFKYYYRPSKKQFLRESIRQKQKGFSR